MCNIPAQLNSDKRFSTRPLLPLTLKTSRPSPLDLFLKIGPSLSGGGGWDYGYQLSFMTIWPLYNFIACFYGWGSTVSRLQSHYEEAVYFLPLEELK